MMGCVHWLLLFLLCDKNQCRLSAEYYVAICKKKLIFESSDCCQFVLNIQHCCVQWQKNASSSTHTSIRSFYWHLITSSLKSHHTPAGPDSISSDTVFTICSLPPLFSLSHLSKSQAHFISTYCVCSQKKSDKKVVDVVWLTQEGVFPTHKESLPLKLPNASSYTHKVKLHD